MKYGYLLRPMIAVDLLVNLTDFFNSDLMKQMRQMMTKFQERNGATQCKLLKGIGTKVVLRECPLCVADAAEFLEELIQQETV